MNKKTKRQTEKLAHQITRDNQNYKNHSKNLETLQLFCLKNTEISPKDIVICYFTHNFAKLAFLCFFDQVAILSFQYLSNS